MASAAERLSDGASEEKKIGSGHDHVEDPGLRHTIENLPDPDAGLSEEERAAHVHLPFNLSEKKILTHLQDRKLLWKLDLKLLPWLS